AQIRERCRRGKRFAALAGRVSVLGHAPYGYRYIRKHQGGGTARYEIDPQPAAGVRQIFAWAAPERLAPAQSSPRLNPQGVPTPAGRGVWRPGTVQMILRNPAYPGTAHYGKKRSVPRVPQLRPWRGQPEVSRWPYSRTGVGTEPTAIAVPALV